MSVTLIRLINVYKLEFGATTPVTIPGVLSITSSVKRQMMRSQNADGAPGPSNSHAVNQDLSGKVTFEGYGQRSALLKSSPEPMVAYGEDAESGAKKKVTFLNVLFEGDDSNIAQNGQQKYGETSVTFIQDNEQNTDGTWKTIDDLVKVEAAT
jgi:hypothetical protein